MNDGDAIGALGKVFDNFLREAMCLQACAQRDGNADVEGRIRMFIEALSAAQKVCLGSDGTRYSTDGDQKRPRESRDMGYAVSPSLSVH